MKKNLLWMMAAILTCSLMTACSSSSDDDNNSKQNRIEVLYSTILSEDMLKVADLTVVYLDQAGNKQQETLTTTSWEKSISINTLPMNVGICVKANPKSSIAEGEYKLDVTSTAAIAGITASGKEIPKRLVHTPQKREQRTRCPHTAMPSRARLSESMPMAT